MYNVIGKGIDYKSGPYTVKFVAWQNTALFNVALVNDNVVENDKNFTLIIDPLSLPHGITLGHPNQTTVIIIDDDSEWVTTYCTHTFIVILLIFLYYL